MSFGFIPLNPFRKYSRSKSAVASRKRRYWKKRGFSTKKIKSGRNRGHRAIWF